jgi:hypothetical protein
MGVFDKKGMAGRGGLTPRCGKKSKCAGLPLTTIGERGHHP